MERYYVTFDAGTQSVKVAVYDEELQCVASSSHMTELRYPHPGWVEMDVDAYLQGALDGMRDCVQKMREAGRDTGKVAAIMGDGIICGVAGIDEQGKAITPYINYLDSRTKEDAAGLAGRHLEIWGRETGNPEPLCMFPALHARWLLQNIAAFRERGAKFVHNAPYVLMRLAGLSAKDAFVDWGAMSGWGMGYDVQRKAWSKEQLDILGLDIRYMPRIVKPWEIIGHLSAEMAEETGLPEGVPICGGAGDTMQSMLGCGIFEAGRAVDVAGTCAMFCASTSGIIPELSQPGSGLIFNSGTLENTYFYWGFVRTGGLALRWFKDNVCGKADDGNYYQILSERAKDVPPGCDGVLFLPYLTGGYEGSEVKGCFLNMTMASDQAVLWRAVLEAIAFDYQDVLAVYRSAGLKIPAITVTEGGSRDALWNQIKADVLGSRIETYATAGGALLMNALIASFAAGKTTDLRAELEQRLQPAGTFAPNEENHQIYKKQAAWQKELLRRLQG